jgi:hypothetical protein
MSKFLMFGMSPNQIIARATVNAARVFPAFSDRGTLNVVENAVGRWRIHVGDDVAALEQRQDGSHRRVILADMDHHWQIEGRSRLLGTSQRLEIVGSSDVGRKPRLDPYDDVAMTRDRPTREVDVGIVQNLSIRRRRGRDRFVRC